MMTPVMLTLFLLGSTLARGDGTADKVNQLETKSIHQVIKPSNLETASTRTGDLQIAHMQYQANRMDSQEQNYQQLQQNSQSHVQNEATTQFYNQNQAPNQDPAQQQQFFRRQQNQVPFHSHSGSPDQRVPGLLHQSQPRAHSQSKEQTHDFSAQQLYPDAVLPQQHEQFHQQERRDGILDIQDHPNEARKFDGPSSSVIGGFHSSEARPFFPETFHHQRSAFENMARPIVLPGGVSQTHSSSVVVSGLKNLPVLPALVYTTGSVPSSHAVAYSRPVFQGAAYLKQHWQTPYARYVYSHIL